MQAIVFSGGGNRGPLQVGAMRALLEREIRPEMIVGCSAGALTAAYMAVDLSLDRLDQLEQVWRETTRDDIYPGNKMSTLWRIVTRQDSFFDNRNFYAFLQRTGTDPARTFASTQTAKLYITATELESGTLHVFGDDPGDRVLDALMASTALPPVHPPWEVNGRRYIDGGTVTPLPLRVALDRGATEIYALHLKDPVSPEKNLVQGVMSVMGRSVNTMLRLQADHDLFLIESHPKVSFHYVQLGLSDPPGDMDFSHAQRMFDTGYATMANYLDQIPGTRRHNAPVTPSGLTRAGNGLRRMWARRHPGRNKGQIGEPISGESGSIMPGAAPSPQTEA